MMPMYNLLKCSDIYADSSKSFWQFKRDEQNMNGENPADVTTAGSSSFKYKSSLIENKNDATIAVPLKYMSNFFGSLEMPLINCKIHLETSWTKDCVMSNNDGNATFQITSTKLYVPIVTLSTKDNVNLRKQLNEGFKRSVNWYDYKSKIVTKHLDNDNTTRFLLENSLFLPLITLLKMLLVIQLTINRVQRDLHGKYFLPRVDITNYNVLTDSRNFYDQPINDQIKKYDEIRKIATGKRDDYTKECLLDYQYFKDHYQLIALDLYKQKELDADPRAIQQIEFYGMLNTNSQAFIKRNNIKILQRNNKSSIKNL